MIVDSHTHIPTPDHAVEGAFLKESAPAVEYLRNAGTDAALFTTWRGVLAATAEDLQSGNEAALRLAREYSGFLYPGAVLHPFFPEASLEWLARFRDERWLWVGELLPRSKPDCAFADAPYMKLFEACARHGHVVQLHNTPDVKTVAARFPEMQVVCAHVPAGEECRRLAALPNVWMDLSGQRAGLTIGAMEMVRGLFGAGRLLYGTDFSGYEPRCFLARLRVAFPSPEEQEKVFHGNIERLLGLVGSRPI